MEKKESAQAPATGKPVMTAKPTVIGKPAATKPIIMAKPAAAAGVKPTIAKGILQTEGAKSAAAPKVTLVDVNAPKGPTSTAIRKPLHMLKAKTGPMKPASDTQGVDRGIAAVSASDDVTIAPPGAMDVSHSGTVSVLAGKSYPPARGKVIPVSSQLVESRNRSTEELEEQLQSYLEVCDTVMKPNWEPSDLIDLINLMALALDFDFVTLALIDKDDRGRLLDPVSRGYHIPPRPTVVKEWESCLGGSIGLDWEGLLKIAGDNHSKLAEWVIEEGIKCFGMAPVFGANRVYGFLFFGSYKLSGMNPVAAALFEACGGRIGLSLSAFEEKNEWPETVMTGIRSLRDNFSLVLGYLELISDERDMPAEANAKLLKKCSNTIAESVQLLDKLTKEAAGNA